MEKINWPCPICKEIIDRYRIVPCGHSFCMICCQKSKQCPFCKRDINKLVRVCGVADSLSKEKPDENKEHPLRIKLLQSMQLSEKSFRKQLEIDLEHFITEHQTDYYYYPSIKINVEHPKIKVILNEYQQIFSDLLEIKTVNNGCYQIKIKIPSKT